MESDNGISSIYLVNRYQGALTSADIGNHAVRPQNGRLFPLTANSDHACPTVINVVGRPGTGSLPSTIATTRPPPQVKKSVFYVWLLSCNDSVSVASRKQFLKKIEDIYIFGCEYKIISSNVLKISVISRVRSMSEILIFSKRDEIFWYLPK